MIRRSITLWLLVGLVSWSSGRAGTLVQFRIPPLGDIDVELFDQDKPITVQNFVRYVQSGRYQDSILHRCPVTQLTGVSDFVVQGGGVFVSNRGKTNAILEFVPSFGDIKNEYAVGRRFSNTYGTIAMAKRAGDTNSASSQWFFNLGNNSFLDKEDTNNLFVVFGRVVGGTNVLNQFIGRSYGRGVVNLGGVLSELPVNYLDNRAPEFSDLFYTDITLLIVHAQSIATGEREISWNSASNQVNVVEFTEAFPPIWRTLVSTNGDGSTMRVRDASTDNAARFYRVRVEF